MATRSKMSDEKSGKKRVPTREARQESQHTVDEGVQDRHSAGRDTSVGVDLLQDWGEKKKISSTRSKDVTR